MWEGPSRPDQPKRRSGSGHKAPSHIETQDNVAWIHGAGLRGCGGARGPKEFGDTPRKALIIGYCAPDRRGQMIGAYYLVRDLLVSSGSLIGALLWNYGAGVNFASAAILGALYYCITTRLGPGRSTPP